MKIDEHGWKKIDENGWKKKIDEHLIKIDEGENWWKKSKKYETW